MFIQKFKEYCAYIGWNWLGENPFNNLKNFRVENSLIQFGNTIKEFEGDIIDLKDFFDELPYQSELDLEDIMEATKSQQKQVDFTMVKNTFRHQPQSSITHLISNPTQDELSNLELFVKMIGKSSSFAHLAHKKLQ